MARRRRVSLGLLALIAFCLLPAGAYAQTLTATPDPLDFGDAIFNNRTASIWLDLNNDGNLPVQVSYTVSGADSGAFGFGRLYSPISPGPGSPRDLEVSFEPTEARAYAATLVIQTNNPSQPQLEIPVLGTGVGPNLTVDPGPDYTFPDTAVNSSSDPVTFTITNVGTADVPLTTDMGGNGYAVDWHDIPGGWLPVGYQKFITVTFAPQDPGQHDLTLELVVSAMDNNPRVPALYLYIHGLATGGEDGGSGGDGGTGGHEGPGPATTCGCGVPVGDVGAPGALAFLALLAWGARSRRRRRARSGRD